MITQELLGYIKGELGKGRTREEINKKLLGGGGWTEDDLSEAFKTIVPMQGNVVFGAGHERPMEEKPTVSSAPTTPAHVSIVPPLSSPKPFVSSVIPPPSASPTIPPSASVVTPPAFKPMSTIPPSTPLVPPTTPPIIPVISPVTPAVISTPHITPPLVTPPPPSFTPSVVPKTQIQTPKPIFTPPIYTPPAPAPTFSSSPLKQSQPVLPSPPPPPPSHSFSWLKFIIIFVIVAGLGFALWYFRSPIINFSNSLMEKLF